MERGVGLPPNGRRRGLSGIVALAAAGALLAAAGTNQVGAAAPPVSDFDGDGYGDLVLGVAGEDHSGSIDAGMVTVIYGKKSGVNRKRSQGLSQAGSVVGEAEPGDQFGRAYTTGDINGDGRSDLVVGAPNEAVGAVQAAGTITVLYGSPRGLSNKGTQEFSQADVPWGRVETGDRFGTALTVGDFNGDGYEDVAVGVPGEDVGVIVDAGQIDVFYGSASGLTAAGSRSFSQNGAVAGTAEQDDRMGWSVIAGDFNGDGRFDIAAGVPGENIGPAADAGAVTVIYGTPGGLSASGSATISQAGSYKGAPEGGDLFGFSVASADFNGDNRDDLAIGVPGEDAKRKVDAGSVNVVYGRGRGLAPRGNQTFSQAGKVNGKVEADDRFGESVVAADFDGNGKYDLAIGVPGEDRFGDTDAGQVNVLYGSKKGLRKAGDYSFSQAGKIAGSVEAHDLLGSSVMALDLNGDGYDELVAGVPGEDIKSATDAGQANVVYGSKKGLRSRGNEAVGQQGIIAGRAEDGDSLGLPTYETWLDRVNLYRRQASLDPVSERSRLSSAAVKHSKYMVVNGEVAHSESPGKPSYSKAGNASGGRSNVYGTTLWSTTDIAAVDGWVTGPFHAVGFLTPNLREVGYGVYRDPDASYIRMAATLDIWGAQRDWDKTPSSAYAWPGNGSVVPVKRHINEWPSPKTHCSNHDGLPVLAFFTRSVDVSSVSFTHNGQPLQHCSFDGTDYRNPNSSARRLGRQILDGANTVVVMPKRALTPGETYCFSVTSRNESVDSCFTVDPNA